MSVTSKYERPEMADRSTGLSAIEAADTPAETAGELGVLIRKLGEILAAIIATFVKRGNRKTAAQLAEQANQINQLEVSVATLREERRLPLLLLVPVACKHSNEIDKLKDRLAQLEQRPESQSEILVYREREVIPFSWWAALVGFLMGGLSTYLLLPLWVASTVTLEMGQEAQQVAIGSVLEMQPIVIAASVLVGLITGVGTGYLLGIPLYRRRVDREAA